jgi:hypothetical protein
MKVKKFNQIVILFESLDKKTMSRVDAGVLDVIEFLKDNNIHNWTEFTTSGRFDRWVVDKIIDSNCETKEDLNEFRYKLKLKLSDLEQLRLMLKEYEEMEEYEKCSEIQQEMSIRK